MLRSRDDTRYTVKVYVAWLSFILHVWETFATKYTVLNGPRRVHTVRKKILESVQERFLQFWWFRQNASISESMNYNLLIFGNFWKTGVGKTVPDQSSYSEQVYQKSFSSQFQTQSTHVPHEMYYSNSPTDRHRYIKRLY